MKQRYFGEPVVGKKVTNKGYIDIIGPSADGTPTTFVDSEEYAKFGGRFKYALSNGLPEFNSEAELIQMYRDISDHADVDFAIEEITNELFVVDGESVPVFIDLDGIEEEVLNDDTKGKIKKEFSAILNMMNFTNDAFEIFRRFYVDSRLCYYKVVDPSDTKKGILDLRIMDPVSVRKVRQIIKKKIDLGNDGFIQDYEDVKEYYIYTPNNSAYSNKVGTLELSGFGALSGAMIGNLGASDNVQILGSYAVAEITSGQYDYSKGCVKGFLHKAIKPLNDLTNLEVHMIIYRIARAPERRVFYIDTGNLPPKKAQQYLNYVQDSHRSEVTYDSASGRIRSDSRTISMHEDFWLPRSSDGKGTQVETLSGAQNLNQIEDIEYLNRKFHNSLNIPPSRFDAENASAQYFFGANRENTREEVKFQKFVSRLRGKFNELFRDILGTQLILKGIVSPDTWWDIQDKITFDYVRDRYIEDSRRFAIFQQKMEIAKEADDLVGKYISKKYIWENILGFDSDDIQLEIERMAEEAKNSSDDEDVGFY